jgi:peptidoglycan/xylan/chitin deacetylase (PgdA/CDA1 family)
MPRIVVFTGDMSFAVCKGIVELDRRIAGVEWLIVRHSPPRTLTKLIRNQLRNLRRNGWRWLVYQGSEAFSRLPATLAANDAVVDPTRPGSDYLLERVLARPNVAWISTPDLHNADTLARVRGFAPDVGLSLATPILKEALFGIPRLGTLNLHKGKLPEYRGMPPAFWELWNGETQIGCTVHYINAGLDKGDIVSQTAIPRQRYSTLKALQLTLDEVGIELTVEAVVAVLAGDAKPLSQPSGGRTYTKPTLGQIEILRRRLADALPGPRSPARTFAKNAYLFMLLLAGRAWLRLFSKTPTVTVVLYHRVSDELRDSLTTGIEQFDRQMALIGRFCHPLTIDQVVNGQFPPHASKPLVCVTFDDGYKDNYSNAMPLLLRHRIPAAFFVSTGFVGTEREFPHDMGKLPERVANMSWDDLRAMKASGFSIGSHTVSHIDCASAPADVVQGELRDSLQQLRSELSLRDVILAYPFGGRQHMTPERLEWVKHAGYVGCLSAYGGFNRGSVDRYNVLRCGINWGFSDLAFRCRIAGLR